MNTSNDSEYELAEQRERAKKFYRLVGELARRIDVESKDCKTVPDLFTVKQECYRQKLRDNCEKVILTDPFAHGKKSLEVLWRKAYYETIVLAKKLRESDDDDFYINMLIETGIANFHHLMFKVSFEFQIKLDSIDFPSYELDDLKEVKVIDEDLIQWTKSFMHSCLIYLGDLLRYQREIMKNTDILTPARYYLQAVKIDISLGMPYNQLGNLYMGVNHNLNSVSYYLQCLSCQIPFDGADGNLARIFELNAINNENISGEIATVQTDSVKIQLFTHKLLSLVEAWYLKKKHTIITQLCSDVLKELKVCLNLKQKLNPYDDINESENPSYLNNNYLYQVTKICLFTVLILKDDPDRAFTVKAFILALYSQLLQKLLSQLNSFGLHLINVEKEKKLNGIVKPQEKTLNTGDVKVNGSKNETAAPDCNNDTKISNGDIKSVKVKKVTKRRRRKKMSLSDSSNNSESDSEMSDHFKTDNESDIEISNDDDYTDTESSNDEELLNAQDGNLSDDQDYIIEAEELISNAKIDMKGIESFLKGNNMLPSILLLQDWILTEVDLLKHCGDTGEPIFQSLVDALNIFLMHFYGKYSYQDVATCEALEDTKSFIKKIGRGYKSSPMPEDVDVKGTPLCKYDRDATEWEVLKDYSFTVFHENVIRVLKFMDFGFGLAKHVPNIRFNKYSKIFFTKRNPIQKTSLKTSKIGRDVRERKRIPRVPITKTTSYKHSHHSHSQLSQTSKGVHDAALMRNLGKLWLQNQVKELETAVRHGGRHHDFPLYLTIDSDALCHHTKLVKQLVKARKFVVLIPTVVLQTIDELKKDEGGARDAIRWLENQLHKGSRFLRTQRPTETKPIPLLKYPKKVSKSTQNFIQIIEFCNYFIETENDKTWGGNGEPDSTKLKKDNKSSVILLLTGSNFDQNDAKEMSLKSIAASGGVQHESIAHFFTRWKYLTHKNVKKG